MRRDPQIVFCPYCGEPVGATLALGHPMPGIYHIPCAEREASEDERTEEQAKHQEKEGK